MKIWVYDVPLLVILGFTLALVHAKKLQKRNPDYFSFFLTFFTLVFWLNIFLSLIGVIKPWGGPLVGYAVDLNPWIGVFYALSYPFWFWYSGEIAFGLFGRTPRQGGFLWTLTLKDKTEPFEPSWEEE